MHKAGLIAVMLLISSVHIAFGQEGEADGNALLHRCSIVIKMADGQSASSPLDNLDAGMCMGVVRGTADVMSLWQSVDHGGQVDNSPIHGCLPDPLKTIEMVKVVVKYLNDHPERLHVADTRLVLMALADAYPCKKSQ